MNRRIAAYLMLSVALAATVFCYTLLLCMTDSQIAGASVQRRYFTMGVEMTRGVDYAISDALANRLQQRLPHSFAIATGFVSPPKYNSLALPDSSKSIHVAIHHVSTRYFQSLELPNLLGHGITPAEVRAGAPVIVVNRRCADALFGSAKASLDHTVILRIAADSAGTIPPLHVIGVVPDDFTGIRAADRYFLRKMPMAWVFQRPDLLEPALLSVPRNLSKNEIRHALNLAWRNVSIPGRPAGSRGIVFSQPVSMEPGAVAALVHRLKLYLGVSLAALLLALVNVSAVNFLEALRLRSVHAIERTLGATREWHLRRVLNRSLLGALVTAAATGTLLTIAVLVTQRAISAVHLLWHSPWVHIDPASHWMQLFIPVVSVCLAVLFIEVLVHGASLMRERHDVLSPRVSSALGQRRVGGVILLLEFAFAFLLGVLAIWGAQYAWRIAHEDLGMLQGRRLAVVSMAVNWAYLDAHPHAASRRIPNAVMSADLQRAVVGIDPHAKVAFGPVIGFPYRHGMGNFRRGEGQLQVGDAAIFTQGFAVSTNWLGVGGARLLAGRDFNSRKPDPREILVDADTARAMFGSVRAAVGRQVHWKVFWARDPIPFRVRGVLAPLRLDGPGRAPVASIIEPLQGGGDHFTGGNGGAFLIRPAIPAARYAALRSAVGRVFAKDAPSLEVSGVQSSTQLLSRIDRPQRILATVFGAVAGFGLLIALTGLTVLLRLFLAMRKRVDAIQQALGASPRRLYSGVVGGTVILGLAGALLALLFTPWLAQQFALLSGAQVAPFGWPTWIALAVLLLAVFLVVHFPARRAACAEPAESLHEL